MSWLLAVVGGFASGVFLRSLFSFQWEPTVFFFLLALLFAGALFFGEARRVYSLAALFCIFLAFGMMRAAVTDTPLPGVFAGDLKQRVSYDGIVIADPDVRDASQRVEIRVSSGGASTGMLVIALRYPSVAVGDRVRVFGTLAVPEPFVSDNGRVFRYDKYLERDGIRFMLMFASIHTVAPAPWYSIPAALARAKHLFLNGLNAALPEPYSSLAGGVVIGGKTGLGNDLQNAFIRSGLVQIIVLSGYNVMIVAEWVLAGLAFAGLSRRWSIAAGALAVLFFVGVAGASATAVRAMLMAFIALYARATGRSYAAGRALLIVIFMMLLWNPLYLVFDPGFDLSVAATAGLIWLAPIFERLINERKTVWFAGVSKVQRRPIAPSGAMGSSETLPQTTPSFASSFWTNAVATTLAAQTAVLPLLLYETGNLSFVALPANLLAMPVVPLAMGFSAVAGFAGMLFGSTLPLLSSMIAFPGYLANAFLIWLAREAAALPLAAFTLPPFPFASVLAVYAALFFIASSKRFSTTPQLRLVKNAST